MGDNLADVWQSISHAIGIGWQWIEDSNGAVTALATIATAAFAVWAIVNAGRDSRDRSRPMVIAEFRHARDSDTTVDLVIHNAGVSMAREVSVTFDPPLVVPEGFGRNVTDHIIRRYSSALSGLAPSQTFRNVWWAGHMVAGSSDLENAEPTPDQVAVAINYTDDRGRPYSDTFALDVLNLLQETYSVSSTSVKGRLKTIDASLKTTSKALETVARVAKAANRRASGDVDAAPRGIPVEHLHALLGGRHAVSDGGDAEVEQPGVEQPGVEQPGVEQPEVEQPEVEQP
ncbi:hypothetical protein [Cellulomonas sp.]|uniref:hypothetical protein n=1 Tax=Cellulomonas sp. TaxID=40001 RepID=UPI003BABE945